MAEPISIALVVGAGTMGRGIAQLAAQRGIEVRLFDAAPAQVERAVSDVTKQLERLVSKGKLTGAEQSRALARLRPASDLGAACADVDVVIEAAPELMDLKVKLFSEAREASPRTRCWARTHRACPSRRSVSARERRSASSACTSSTLRR